MRIVLCLLGSLIFFSNAICFGAAEDVLINPFREISREPGGQVSSATKSGEPATPVTDPAVTAAPDISGDSADSTQAVPKNETATDSIDQTANEQQQPAIAPDSAPNAGSAPAAIAKPPSDQQTIIDYIGELNGLNARLMQTDDDDTVNQLLNDKLTVIDKLMSKLRSTPIEKLPPAATSEQLNFLNSRIAVNQERGNQLAVQRDQLKREYYKTDQAIRTFLQDLIYAAHNYQSAAEVQEIALAALTEYSREETEYLPPELTTDSKVYADLQENYRQLLAANTGYQDLLNYVVDNPGIIVSSHWFHLLSVHSLISYINSIEAFKLFNYKLAPLKVDVGGILTSLLIFSLVFFSYPLLFRFSRWIIENFLFDEEYGNEELIYEELRRPIKFLLIFIGIDLATYALLYKTEYRPSLEHFSFVIYTLIDIWLLFKVLDCFVIVQVQKISRSNKELRKELFHLGVQIAKGVMAIIISAMILNHFGISITAIMSTLGIGGLAFALAAKDTLSNLFGGVTILLDNVFRMGDWVKIGDMEGTVAEVGLRSTTLRTFENALVTIPNSVISVSSVINWNRRAVGRRIKMHVGVTYESNMDDIRSALQDLRSMLKVHPDIANPKHKLNNRKKQVRFSSLEDTQGIKSTQLVFLDRYNDFSIDILIYCFSRSVDWEQWLQVKEDVLFKIAGILQKNNLQFAYPTQVTVLRGEESAQFESKALAQGYAQSR